MPFKPLLELRVEHPFFEAGLCHPARIVAPRATADRLRGLRLIARGGRGALTLAADLAPDGSPKVPIPAATLRFDLLQLEGELLAATDLEGILPGTVFSDAGPSKPMKPHVREVRAEETLEKPEGPAGIVLKGSPRIGAAPADFTVVSPAGVSVEAYEPAAKRISLGGPKGQVRIEYPVAPIKAPGTLAGIDVPIGPELVAKAASGKPRRFTVPLQAAAAPWCYHLVTDLPNPLAEWRIEHPARDGPPASFGGGSIVEIATPVSTDAFGSELLRRSSPLRVLRFVSDAPVPCSEGRARRIALFAGSRQLFSALPNPSPSRIRFLNGKPVFGEVLRFVTS
jgi:hypothetical protein